MYTINLTFIDVLPGLLTIVRRNYPVLKLYITFQL